MGCTSGKVAKPTPLSKDVAVVQNTLLSSPGKEGMTKAAGKPAQPSFVGAWTGGVIGGNLLTWKNGTKSQIRTDSSEPELRDSASCCYTQGLMLVGMLVATFEGDTFTGELLADGRIYWHDGTVWSRYHVCASFQEFMGYIDHGPDLLVETMTLEQAKSKAATMPHCQGFSYEGDATHESVKVYFKSHWNITGIESGWRSCKKEEVACQVGDDVMAVFGPTGLRYPAEIKSICVDLPPLMGSMWERNAASYRLQEYSRMVLDESQVVVNWKDGGNTHCVVSAAQVCKDPTTLMYVTDVTLPQDNLESVTLPQNNLESVPDTEVSVPGASPGLEVGASPGLEVGLDAARSNLSQPEEPSPSKTLAPTVPKEASPSSTLKQAINRAQVSSEIILEPSPSSSHVAQNMLPSGRAGARKEKSMCCC